MIRYLSLVMFVLGIVSCKQHIPASQPYIPANQPLNEQQYSLWRTALSNQCDLYLPTNAIEAHIDSIALFVEIVMVKLCLSRGQTLWFFNNNTNVASYSSLRFDREIADRIAGYGPVHGKPWWITNNCADGVYGVRYGSRVVNGHTWRYTTHVAVLDIEAETNILYICRTEE